MTEPVGIAVIGLGFGARVHLPGYAALGEEARVVTVCGRNAARTAAVAREAGVPFSTDDWREALAHPDVELMSIATPPASHVEIAAAALQAGKAVLCEKPLALSTDDAFALAELAGRTSMSTIVNLSYRAVPAFRVAHDLIAARRLGDIQRIDLLWQRPRPWSENDPLSWKDSSDAGGGVLANYGVHALDYIGWLAGSPRAVRAVLEQPAESPERPDDRMVAELTLRGGATAHIDVSLRGDAREGLTHRVDFIGSQGTLTLAASDPADHVAFTLKLNGASIDVGDFPFKVATTTDPRAAPFATHAAAIVRALRGGPPPSPSFDESLPAHAALEAAQRSASSGREEAVVHRGSSETEQVPSGA
jgi:predicted dehydrogenase